MHTKNTPLLYFTITLALIGYILPWITTQTAPLTLGAYDLAEWVSLHPSQPYTTPVLIVPLLLRLNLVIIVLIIALSAHTDKLRIFTIFAIVPLSLAQLPPLEFLTIATNNINYQQQFVLATISLVLGIGLSVFKPVRFIPQINIFLVGVGIVSAITGLQQAQALYIMSLQENSLGMGVIVIGIAYIIIALTYLQSLIIKFPTSKLQQLLEIKQGSH